MREESGSSMVSAKVIAKYIVSFFQEVGDPITNLKLQKLLYYVQGWHLALFGKPAFSDEVQAWVHGPVCLEVYRAYKHNKWSPIIEVQDSYKIDESLENHIDEVIDVYGEDAGWALERRTHAEAPWLTARKGLEADEESSNPISHQSMIDFFSTLADNGED